MREVSGTRHIRPHALLEKIEQLPPEKVAEVEDFVDFLRLRQVEKNLTREAMALSQDACLRAWNNDADADYDEP